MDRPTPNPRASVGMRSARAKRDDSIMGTNDSSIVSKRSVAKLYYPNEPDFYEPFVLKFARRNPLINRGYWLRMYAIETVVRQFIEQEDGKKKFVVNLGCGYDPMPFQFWHRYPSLCENTTFIDVDYPQLIQKKKVLISRSHLLQDFLGGSNLCSSEAPIYIRSDRYLALGCDLRDVATLDRLLKNEISNQQCSFLFTAEVSLTYMNVLDADAIISWASSFPDSSFCILEQFLPDGPKHPFAKTMLDHFNKLTTTIHAVKKYPLLSQQKDRFVTAGWPSVQISNLWDFWSDSSRISSEQRKELDKVEPFDEWEEFALFAGHYFLLVATNGATGNLSKRDSVPFELQEQEGFKLTLQHLTLEKENAITPRRFGAVFSHEDDTLILHGGQSTQNRSCTVDVLTRSSHASRIKGTAAGARVCHTITSTHTSGSLMVGGRTSPNRCLSDCWLLKNLQWIRVQDLEPARYRHCAIGISISTNEVQTDAVLVFGGKTDSGHILGDWKIWISNYGWRDVNISSVGPRPQARFGAAMARTSGNNGFQRGLLMGGIGADGVVLEDIWEWEITFDSDICLSFCESSCGLATTSNLSYARIGASLLPFGENNLLLVGGVAKTNILGLLDEILVVHWKDTIQFKRISGLTSPTERPLLVGFGATSIANVDENPEVIVIGGGAVCFSMGSFWNTGYISIRVGADAAASTWRVSQIGVQDSMLQFKKNLQCRSKLQLVEAPSATKFTENAQQRGNAIAKAEVVPRIQLHSTADFERISSAAQPVILEGLDLGPCVKVWTPEYLKEQVGVDRRIVVHESQDDEMNFRDKNFDYVKKPFGDFIDGIVRGGKMYLRSLSNSQPSKLPTNLSLDFPTIAPDFRIPELLSPILSNVHSCPLRISGPVSLWLHYDVLSNVLFQIQSSKVLTLYPPSDVSHLRFPPGGSSSHIPVSVIQATGIPHTHPRRADLRPGDALFIPPMWAHSATPALEGGISVAVNVFWRNLEGQGNGGYAAGRDVYGNRDLQAYENGRRDVGRIIQAFRDVPRDIAGFYLERLAMEMGERVKELRGGEGMLS